MTPQYDLLIVDDDPTVIVVLGSMLRPFGQVRFAKRGADALRLARQSIPDLVLLDLQLPDISGLQVLAEMRRSPLLADVPVVMLTGTDAGPELDEARRLGAADCLAKPPQAAALAACVRAQLDDGLRRIALQCPRGGGEWHAASNRRGFDMLLALACSRMPAEGQRMALLRLGNARWMDGPGAAALPAEGLEGLAQAVRQVARRPGDRIGQLGAEGLALLLPDVDAYGAACVVQALLHQPACAGRMAAGIVVLEPVPAQAADGDRQPAPPGEAARSGGWADQAGHRRVPSAAGLMLAAESALQAARLAGCGQARQVAWRADIGAGRPMPLPEQPSPPPEAG